MKFPNRFGRFWLQEKIGEGGMAEIFRATIGPDPESYAFDCVVKRMHKKLRGDERYETMFRIEQYLAMQLRHPNIIETYDAGSIDDAMYIAMEYVRGVNVHQLMTLLEDHYMSFPEAIAIYIAMQVLRALDYLHRAKASGSKALELIHRDITPANIFLSFSGEVKIGDFGIARVAILERQEDNELVKGKPAYIPRETLRGNDPTQQDDLWSLAVCLYEMTTSTVAHEHVGNQEIIDHTPSLKIPPDDASTPLDKKLIKLLSMLLSRNPKARPQNAAGFHGELKRHLPAQALEGARETLARFVLAMAGDVSHMSRAFEPRLRDATTGAYTYKHLLEVMQVELNRCRRYHRNFTILIIGPDPSGTSTRGLIPSVNKAILARLAHTFMDSNAGLRSSDTLAHSRHDKFCVILPETMRNKGMIVAERLRSIVDAADWSDLDPTVKTLTVSIGVSSFPRHGETVGALLQAADVARFHAQQQGGNQTLLASDELAELKKKVGDGVATSEELVRWEELQEEQRAAQTPMGQRRFHRAAISVDIEFATQQELIRAYSFDISTGGLRIVVPGDFEVGVQLELHVQLPGDDKTISIPSRVAWVRANSDIVGFEFLALPPATLEHIELLVWGEVGDPELVF